MWIAPARRPSASRTKRDVIFAASMRWRAADANSSASIVFGSGCEHSPAVFERSSRSVSINRRRSPSEMTPRSSPCPLRRP